MNMTALKDGCMPIVALSKGRLQEGLVRNGFWELREPQDLARLGPGKLPATGTFLDIGANIGVWSLIFARAGWRIVAVEPFPPNRRAFQASLSCLHPELKERISIVPKALSEQTVVAEQHSCVARSQMLPMAHVLNVGNAELFCGRGMSCQLLKRHYTDCEAVNVSTLDAVLEELQVATIDAVKIDVEGRECAVFRGGLNLLTRFRPRFILYEHKQPGVQVCMSALAKSYNYRHGRYTVGDNRLLVANEARRSL